ncbi:helix-turn-helix domain-containing protein [Janthinobacterium fluminis]|uniref:Helix-turn-helix transcriptional regulator n=1 Tax=Janthinobacterium fluminis TaxID=2987524 RepID=A0ABT5JXH9_9BURK|nr:helix-turn-helix transcriptional regulator [Janthinobacterium fluminis]MDC8756237.1 helix-turn-helix transcriptional regulator [Janthinobacterium fluminis]
MNPIARIRAQLGVTQSAMAEALNVTQGNISHYERGQGIPPEMAKRLIAYALTMGQVVTFEQIYGLVQPPIVGHAGRQSPSPHQILDMVPECAVVTTFPPKEISRG